MHRPAPIPPPIRAARVSKRYQQRRLPQRIHRQAPTQSLPPPQHSSRPLRPPSPMPIFRRILLQPAASRLSPRASDVRSSKFRLFDVSTFRRFHQKPPETPSAPTHARHKRWHDFPEHCVTLCHLRFCTTCARATRWSLPSAPWPLDPSAPFFTFGNCSPTDDLPSPLDCPAPFS
jgi:hypothetical protein